MSDKFERLPAFAKPEHYQLHLEPELKDFTCNGRVDILLNVTEATDFIKLHFACHDFRSAKLLLENGKEWMNLKFEVDKKWKTAVVYLPEKLSPQKATLTIDFETEINSGLNGLYRSTYKDKNGQEKFLASTQFESEGARLCFPCFDEPEFKARFTCELLVDQKLTALSNMNVTEEVQQGNEKRLVKFATTPIMSTYLLAFVAGELEYIETTYGSKNIPIRVYTVLGKKEKAHFSLMHAKKAMEYFEDWFGFEMPLPKLDMIAIPDFGMGAMENWSLVTYREIFMVHDENTTHMVKNRSAMVIFHELAHFWFGNLVTMRWWGELWLKEGFASFCQYVLMNNVCPEFKILLEYLPEIVHVAMKADEILSSHSIEIDINAPSDLDSYYDAITYNKSNSVIRMLYNYLGNDIFKNGLRKYIKKNAYGNTTCDDLWAALSEASNQNIKEIMDSWIKQMGFPLVVVEDEKLDGNKRKLRFKQTRYLADGSTDNQIWQIPITLVKSSNPNEPFHKFLFTQFEQEIVLDNVGDNEWIKVNGATSGFYRVQYSHSMLNSLLKSINELDVKDRFGLASDLLALTESGRIPASQFLSFASELTNENEYIVWDIVIGGILKISILLDNNLPELKPKFDKFASQILEPVAKRLTWAFEKGEDSHRAVLRSLVLGALTRLEHTETIQHTLKLFDEYKSGNTGAVHPELRKMVLTVASKNRPELADYFFETYKTCGNSELERDCLFALSRVGNEDLRKEIYDKGIRGQEFRAQDLMYLFLLSGVSAKDQQFAWNYVRNNYKDLVARYNGRASNLACTNCFKCATSSHCTEKFASDFEEFFNSIDGEVRESWNIRYKQSLEQVQNNIKFYKQQRDSIAEFLAQN